MKKLKNFIKGLFIGTLLITSTATLLFMGVGSLNFQIFQIPVALISAGTMVVSGSRLQNVIVGNVTKQTIFSVDRNGSIFQNSRSHPLITLELLLTKNKKESFKKELFKMFKQLKKRNSKGEIINYQTESHSQTYRYLETLEKNGYIENLHKEPLGKRSFLKESLLFGNTNISKNKKKYYLITFNLTDKQINEEYEKSFYGTNDYVDTSRKSKNEREKDKNEEQKKNHSRQEQIAELKALRNSLVDNNQLTNENQHKL